MHAVDAITYAYLPDHHIHRFIFHRIDLIALDQYVNTVCDVWQRASAPGQPPYLRVLLDFQKSGLPSLMHWTTRLRLKRRTFARDTPPSCIAYLVRNHEEARQVRRLTFSGLSYWPNSRAPFFNEADALRWLHQQTEEQQPR